MPYEILVHISAPTTKRGDDLYRDEALAYRDFKPSRKLFLDERDGRKAAAIFRHPRYHVLKEEKVQDIQGAPLETYGLDSFSMTEPDSSNQVSRQCETQVILDTQQAIGVLNSQISTITNSFYDGTTLSLTEHRPAKRPRTAEAILEPFFSGRDDLQDPDYPPSNHSPHSLALTTSFSALDQISSLLPDSYGLSKSDSIQNSGQKKNGMNLSLYPATPPKLRQGFSTAYYTADNNDAAALLLGLRTEGILEISHMSPGRNESPTAGKSRAPFRDRLIAPAQQGSDSSRQQTPDASLPFEPSSVNCSDGEIQSPIFERALMNSSDPALTEAYVALKGVRGKLSLEAVSVNSPSRGSLVKDTRDNGVDTNEPDHGTNIFHACHVSEMEGHEISIERTNSRRSSISVEKNRMIDGTTKRKMAHQTLIRLPVEESDFKSRRNGSLSSYHEDAIPEIRDRQITQSRKPDKIDISRRSSKEPQESVIPDCNGNPEKLLNGFMTMPAPKIVIVPPPSIPTGGKLDKRLEKLLQEINGLPVEVFSPKAPVGLDGPVTFVTPIIASFYAKAELRKRWTRMLLVSPGAQITPALPTYKYDPIDEHVDQFRFLKLHPGPKSAAIQIEIGIFSPHQLPFYEALSYTWGDLSDTGLISVGLDPAKTLSVTRNLYDALLHLRYETKPRLLWIDAICIDQSNLEERGSQVQKMGQIYKRANRVVVWLGPEADDSTHAMKLIEFLASKVEVDWDALAIKPSLDGADEPHWADCNAVLSLSARDWRALYSLLGRVWFERLWVRQEIVLAQKTVVVSCGTTTILWDDFRNSIYLLHAKPSNSMDQLSSEESTQFFARCQHIYLMANYKSSTATWRMLRNAGPSKCSDPRDKVYANLGLIQESEGDIGLKPNYDQSVREVKIQLVLALLDYHKRLDILRCCELSDERGDLPSWTPNWSISTRFFGFVESDAYAHANAQYLGNGVLRVEGIVGGVLESTRVYQEREYSAHTCSEIYQSVPNSVLDEMDKGGSILIDSFCRTLGGGDFRERQPSAEYFPTWQSSRKTVLEILSTKGKYKKSFDRISLNGVNNYGRGRCFFTTEDGTMGWAPKAARAGDIVCVILGCAVPFVLRKTTEARYLVVGECYMDGIMDGELILGVLPESLRKERYLDRENGKWYLRWIDSVTGEVRHQDPREAKFVKEGESTSQVWIGTSFRNPYLTSDRLKVAGVEIRSFDLV
ncbi:hypothetical protein FKW77_010822 [Venturia effusa]|uniref:Heterokaryon incompatibility domain-containing protein n=1 Tax=Venturia effusa TaxID=50376 RepID=A0A517KYJ3_9PEZI|nr:hypothetical protein FKW77_010822 [Venturia effusa]